MREMFYISSPGISVVLSVSDLTHLLIIKLLLAEENTGSHSLGELDRIV